MPIIISKIAPGSSPPKVLNLRGKDNLLNVKKVSSLVRYNSQANPHISKALLCIDSECTDLDKTREQVSSIVLSLKQSFPKLPLNYVIVDHSLEGWLLQDRQALQQCLGPRALLPHYGDPEEQCRPVELMEDIFRRNSQDYKKTMHAPRLAELVDIEIIAKVSQTFQVFQQAILR